MNLIKLKTEFEKMCPGWKLSSVSREDNFIGDSLLLESSTFRFQVDGFRGNPSKACRGMSIQHISSESQRKANFSNTLERLIAQKIYLGVRGMIEGKELPGFKNEKSAVTLGFPREPCKSKLHLVVDNTHSE